MEPGKSTYNFADTQKSDRCKHEDGSIQAENESNNDGKLKKSNNRNKCNSLQAKMASKRHKLAPNSEFPSSAFHCHSESSKGEMLHLIIEKGSKQYLQASCKVSVETEQFQGISGHITLS